MNNELDKILDKLEYKTPDGKDAPLGLFSSKELKQAIEALCQSKCIEARIEELDKVMGGTNTAAGIRTPTAASRNLNLDDLHYYLHNRKRVLNGDKAHTPEEWFNEVR